MTGPFNRQDLRMLCEKPWDMIVVGGGITGAGVMREAARLGLRVLLVEKRDFAWGTSSRSSKLVHGGLRYLKGAHFLLTRDSLVERERLLKESQELVTPLYFLAPTYTGEKPGRYTLALGLSLYDIIAGVWDHKRFALQPFQKMAPHLKTDGLNGGFRYKDAQTDDARLVLRLIFEAETEGGAAFNYMSAEAFEREDGENRRLSLKDEITGETFSARTKVVVNATGIWAERLRKPEKPCLRPLRGSHIVFHASRLPASQAIMFPHPKDRRPMFVLPWEGVTVFGTTDMDHREDIEQEPAITEAETRYLMEALQARFPSLDLSVNDIISSFTGIRPIISKGDPKDPSKESRDHQIWDEDGLITITGGKLTTFRKMAFDLLAKASHYYPNGLKPDSKPPAFNPCAGDWPQLTPIAAARLLGRHGVLAAELMEAAQEGEWASVPGSKTLWAELRWAVRREKVAKLEDLMLRRTRLGLLMEGGGAALMPQIEAVCRAELGWSREHWDAQVEAYLKLWRRCYYLPQSMWPEAVDG